MKVHRVWKIRAFYDAIDWQESLIDAYGGVVSSEAVRVRKQSQKSIDKYKLALRELEHEYKGFLTDGPSIPINEIEVIPPYSGKGERR